jgi:hypothetical protein
VALSSAYAKQGWFFESWIGSEPWHRVKVRAEDCLRISPEFRAEERRVLGPRWYAMEYECEFGDAIHSVFREEDIRAAMDYSLPPLNLGA